MVMSADDEFEDSSISNPKLTVPSSSRLEFMKLLLLEIFCPDPEPALASTPLMMISGIGLVGALEKKSFWKRIENPKNYILWPRELTSFFGKIPVSSPAPTDDVFRRWVFAGVTLTMGKALLDDSFLSILKL